jgi:hypothetical protein
MSASSRSWPSHWWGLAGWARLATRCGSKQHSLQSPPRHGKRKFCKMLRIQRPSSHVGGKVESEADWALRYMQRWIRVETVGLVCSGRCSYDSQLGCLQLSAPLFRAVWRNNRRLPRGMEGAGSTRGWYYHISSKRYQFVRALDCTMSSFTSYVRALIQYPRTSWPIITL